MYVQEEESAWQEVKVMSGTSWESGERYGSEGYDG